MHSLFTDVMNFVFIDHLLSCIIAVPFLGMAVLAFVRNETWIRRIALACTLLTFGQEAQRSMLAGLTDWSIGLPQALCFLPSGRGELWTFAELIGLWSELGARASRWRGGCGRLLTFVTSTKMPNESGARPMRPVTSCKSSNHGRFSTTCSSSTAG